MSLKQTHITLIDPPFHSWKSRRAIDYNDIQFLSPDQVPTTPFLSFVSTYDRSITTSTGLPQMVDESTSGSWTDGQSSSSDNHNKMPAGALTVLVIAAVAITSVIVTLVCMLANSRRTRRTQSRIQATCQPQGSTLSPPTVVVVDRGSTLPPPLPLPPLYTNSTQGPKYFDAPPSYDEAIGTPVHSPVSPTSPPSLQDPTPSPPQAINTLSPRARLGNENEATAAHMTEIELS